MFSGSLVIGLTLLGFAAWLHWYDTKGGPVEEFVTDLDNTYHAKRTKARRRIHVIFAACGLMAIAAAFVGPGPFWVIAWTCVMFALLAVVILAGLDALRTHRYYIDKQLGIRQKHIGEDE